MSISLTGVYLPPAKGIKVGDAGGGGAELERELDFFRAELLRQKIIFEAELRRQREVFEDRLDVMGRENESRDAELKQLRQAVQGLSIRLENANAARPITPRRAPSPASSVAHYADPNHSAVTATDVNASAAPTTAAPSGATTPRPGSVLPRQESPYRRTSSRPPSPSRVRPASAAPIRPHLTTVSRNATLIRLGSTSHDSPWR
jgi:hypothetical protein